MTVLTEPIRQVLEIKNFVGNEWVGSKGEVVDVVNPATLKVIARAPISTEDEFNAAVDVAKDAFPDWRRTPPLARARCLFRLKELVEERFEELSRVQTM